MVEGCRWLTRRKRCWRNTGPPDWHRGAQAYLQINRPIEPARQLTTVGRQPPFIEVGHSRADSPCCGDCMYQGESGVGARPNGKAREAMSTSDATLGIETTTVRPARRFHRHRSLMPPRPGNEASSPVARHKAASCGGDGEGSALPAGTAPQRSCTGAAGAGARHAARSANRRASSGGTTRKPRRSAGLMVLLKLPMCSTRPP